MKWPSHFFIALQVLLYKGEMSSLTSLIPKSTGSLTECEREGHVMALLLKQGCVIVASFPDPLLGLGTRLVLLLLHVLK